MSVKLSLYNAFSMQGMIWSSSLFEITEASECNFECITSHFGKFSMVGDFFFKDHKS